MKCPECGGTRFQRTAFYYLWMEEFVETSLNTAWDDESEREFKDFQDGEWSCTKCWHVLSEEEGEALGVQFERDYT